MKKVLLGSTALVAAGMLAGAGTPARAAEPIKLSLGGYYQAFYVVRAQSDVDVDAPIGNDERIHADDVNQEGEVWFVGETTLDNGVKVGVNIQLEAYAHPDQIDEHYVYFSGNFGRLQIGAENAAPYLMHYSAPGAVVGHGLDSPNLWTMQGNGGNSAGGSPGSPAATPANIPSDANKLTYFTPRFNPGFQFGFSYTPDTTDATRSGTGNGFGRESDSEDIGQENVISLGVNFVRTLGSVDLAWSFGYEHGFVEASPGNTQIQGRDVLTTGFNLGFGGWTVGAGFRFDDEGQTRSSDEFDVVAGVTYGAGPWLVGVQGSYALDEDGVGDTDRVVGGELGGTYTLGPGVRVAGAVQAWKGWGGEVREDFDGVAFTMGTALSF
jgi:hypothetical protein